MILGDIKELVLGNIGRYGDTGVDTINLLEKNINLAIDDVIEGVPSENIQETEDIVTEDRSTSLSPTYTPASTNIFDISKIKYKRGDNSWTTVDKATVRNIQQKVADLSQVGYPAFYYVSGNTNGIVDIDFHPITNRPGEIIRIWFFPILEDLVLDPEENIITKKYHSTVIRIASGYSFHNIVQDRAEGDKWLARGDQKADKINSQEQGGADHNNNPLPPAILILRRRNRRTK